MKKDNKVNRTIKIENAKIFFKNFQGKGSDYNAKGNRNFCLAIDEDMADELKDEGWNVKHRPPRKDDPDKFEQPYIKVNVKYGDYPPRIILINERGKKHLDEDTVGMLDWTRIKNCDVVVRPYNYPAMNGRRAGVSAYLKALYVTIDEDDLERKYSDIPDLDEEELPFGEE